jgi:hypothetical protein
LPASWTLSAAHGPNDHGGGEFALRKLATRLIVATLTGLMAALTISGPAFAGWKW